MIEITNSMRALSNKSITNLGTKKRRLVVWSQEGVKRTSDQFSAKPQKIQPCIIQGTGADLCGSPPADTTEAGTEAVVFVSNCYKTLSGNTQISAAVNIDARPPALQRHARSAVHIVTFTMFRDRDYYPRAGLHTRYLPGRRHEQTCRCERELLWRFLTSQCFYTVGCLM